MSKSNAGVEEEDDILEDNRLSPTEKRKKRIVTVEYDDKARSTKRDSMFECYANFVGETLNAFLTNMENNSCMGDKNF